MMALEESTDFWQCAGAVLKMLNDVGLWGFLNFAVLIGLTSWLILFPKRRIPNLNIFVTYERDTSNYPLKVNLEIRNYTGKAVVIYHPMFQFKRLRAHPQARGHSERRECEVKFPGNQPNQLSEVEYLLRHGEDVRTWVPVDPSHTDQEVEQTIQAHRAGILICGCIWLREKPSFRRLKTKV